MYDNNNNDDNNDHDHDDNNMTACIHSSVFHCG